MRIHESAPGTDLRSPGGRYATGRDPARESGRPLVLVVEDDANDWEIYGKILWYNGYDVVYAADGKDGLRLARELTPDLMLVDLLLPGMDGVELCRRCRAEPSLEEVPIVMLTALSDEAVAGQAKDAGCTEFLEKPQSPVNLLHRVEALVGRPPPSGEGARPELTEET
jgi:DNA-binding response OmpR family regulator